MLQQFLRYDVREMHFSLSTFPFSLGFWGVSASDQAIAVINLTGKAYIQHFKSIQLPWMFVGATIKSVCLWSRTTAWCTDDGSSVGTED